MQWKTAISNVNDGQEIIRGYNLHELVENKSFVETVFLIWRGKLPTVKETKMLNAMLTAMIDHGVGVASAMVPRMVASVGNDLHVSVAAGILALGGNKHGGALEGAAKFFQTNVGVSDLEFLLKSLKEKKVRIPGYGHRVLSHDNRTDTLFTVAKETGLYGKHCSFAVTVGEALNKISSKPLPLNMDGANAAILSDMGFDWRIATGFFILGRVPGLIAHTYEEMMSGEGIRRLDESEIEYEGGEI
ncbi:MAG: citryl-CoA lyase [Candidatus Magasanikbacteria bacterium]|nr:citryl-CoA lyase [Candidatus Magasanikbacteria bacterium]